MKKKSEKDPTQLAPSLSEPEKHQCFLLYIVGFGPAEIEQRSGVRADRIRQWMCREKWGEQRAHYENLLREKNPTIEQPIVQSVVRAKKGERRKEFEEHAGVMAVDDVKHWTQMAPEERLIVAPAIASLNGVHRKNLGMEDEEQGQEKGHISLNFLVSADQPGMVRVLEPEKVRMIEGAKEND